MVNNNKKLSNDCWHEEWYILDEISWRILYTFKIIIQKDKQNDYSSEPSDDEYSDSATKRNELYLTQPWAIMIFLYFVWMFHQFQPFIKRFDVFFNIKMHN